MTSFAAPYGSQFSFYNNNTMTSNMNSNHNGGAVAGFCDGHVIFLRDDAGVTLATGSGSITVYQIVATPDGSSLGGEPAADENQWNAGG